MRIDEQIRRIMRAPKAMRGVRAWAEIVPAFVWSLVVVIVVGMVVIVAAVGEADGVDRQLNWLMWALGLTTVGLFAGVLFGLPRIVQVQRKPPTPNDEDDAAADATTTYPTRPPDAMLEIADWLTKIIVGLGLVNLGKIPGQLTKLADSISTTEVGGVDHSFALAMSVFFPTCGLLLGYMLTRLYLQTALIRGDRQAMHEATAPSLAPPVQDFARNKDVARDLAADSSLQAGDGPPAIGVQHTLASLEGQYRHVEIPDYRQRVLRKNEITAEMFAFAVRAGVSKGWLASQQGDGYLHVYATWVLVSPSPDDAAVLCGRGGSAYQKHTKYRVCEALRRLAEANMIQPPQKAPALALLDGYLGGADDSLRMQVEATRRAIERN